MWYLFCISSPNVNYIFFLNFYFDSLIISRGQNDKLYPNLSWACWQAFKTRSIRSMLYKLFFLLKDLCCCLSMWTSSAGKNQHKSFRSQVTGISVAAVFTAPIEAKTFSTYHSRIELLLNNKLNGRAQLQHFGLTCGLNCWKWQKITYLSDSSTYPIPRTLN